jgi:mono/diheme cytochrome c family protein/rhodanese-related sulfurtransferase
MKEPGLDINDNFAVALDSFTEARSSRARLALSTMAIATALALLTTDIGPVEAASTRLGDGEPNSGGEGLYETYCKVCHGDQGQGYAADNAIALSNQDFLASVSDTFLRRSIANGRPNTAMAAYAKQHGGPLNDHEIGVLIGFIRGWQHEPPVDVSPEPIVGQVAAGRDAFAKHCADCHGSDGQGKSAVSLNNPEFLAAALDGQIRHAIANGRRGTPMLAFGEKLSHGTIDNLVALIRSWQTDALRRSTRSARTGNEGIVLNPDGEAPEFVLSEGRYVTANQLDAALRGKAKLILLDARPASDWKWSHIPGAVSAPHYEPASIIERLPRDGTWIVSYCACPTKLSDQLTDALRQAGFRNTAVLLEGVSWWKQNGYPVARSGG